MLPIIEHPRYTTTLPISGTEVAYRPYLIKEEKIVLLAMQSSDATEMKNAIAQIISNCTFGEQDAYKMNYTDITFLMAKFRGASRGDHIELQINCEEMVPDENNPGEMRQCRVQNDAILDLKKMKLADTLDELKTNQVIKISDTIGIQLKVPGLEIVDYQVDALDISNMLKVCIDFIYKGEDIMKPDEFNKEELEAFDEFIDNLPGTVLDDFQDFFNAIPDITVDIEFECIGCKQKNKKTYTNIQEINSFFA